MVPTSLLNALMLPVMGQVVDMNSHGSIDNKMKLLMNDGMMDTLEKYKEKMNELYMAYNGSYQGALIHHPCKEVLFENYFILVLMKLID